MRGPTSASVASFALLLVVSLAASPALAAHPAVERAERAIEAGRVVPGRDVRPILEALRRSRDVEERRALVDAIADLGETDGDAPNAVKSYLLEEAPPVLLEVARTGNDPFLQGDAISALRGMAVPRAVLEEAAAIAEADPNDFVKSRGEILRGYIRGLPAEDESATARPVETAAAKTAIAYLDKLGVGVSTEALREAARDGNAEIVKALLDAGVAPDTGVKNLDDTPMYLATRIGCSSQEGETDWLVETVRHLVAAGADLAIEDDNHNTALLFAADECGPRIVTLLAEGGAKVNAKNGSGLTPLGFAFMKGKLDNAEVLIAKGARLTADERNMVKSFATSPRARALLDKASKAK
jgi:Ankyrin repeats (3 copies)